MPKLNYDLNYNNIINNYADSLFHKHIMIPPVQYPKLEYRTIPFERKLNDRRGRLFFMIGVQRSGKSTFAKRWHQGLERADGSDGFPRVVIAEDEIRLALHGERYKREAEPMICGMSPIFIRALLNSNDVLFDETNTTERSILKVLEIDPDAQYFHIDTPLETCLLRAYETNQTDLLSSIRRCHGQLEELKAYGLNKKINELREVARGKK